MKAETHIIAWPESLDFNIRFYKTYNKNVVTGSMGDSRSFLCAAKREEHAHSKYLLSPVFFLIFLNLLSLSAAMEASSTCDPPVVTFPNRFAVCDTTPVINAVVYELFLGQRKRSTKNWYKLHWPCCLALCPVFLNTLSYFLQYLFLSKIFTFQKFYILILPSVFFLCGDSDLFLFLHPLVWLLPFSCLLAFCNV